MTRQPCLYFRVLLGGIIIQYYLDRFSRWSTALNLVEKEKELLMTMALHVLPNHRAVENIEGPKQGGGAVTFL